MKHTVIQLATFLQTVDSLFPVPLSQKQNLQDFAVKLHNTATLCTVCENDRIVAMVAGYTENVTENMGYISVVATLPEMQGKGYAGHLVEEFLAIACQKGLVAVHLYAVRDNLPAMAMYHSLGFEEWDKTDDPRPEDVHFIYRFRKEKNA